MSFQEKLFSVNENFAGYYRENGFVVFNDLFSKCEILSIREDVLRQFEVFFESSESTFWTGEFIVSPYDVDRESWRLCAKRIQNSVRNLHAGTKPEILPILRKIGLESPATWIMPEIRIDMPDDETYCQPWHQDWRSGQGSLNSVTIWTPMHDVAREHGAIELIPGSHLDGYKPVDVVAAPPLRYIMRQGPGPDAPALCAELEMGQCAMFSQFLVHRSGVNISPSPRITAQYRFTDRADPAFIENKMRLPSDTEMVWDPIPSAEQIRAKFSVLDSPVAV